MISKCIKRKTYKAIRKHRVNCPQCWTMYNEKHGVKCD